MTLPELQDGTDAVVDGQKLSIVRVGQSGVRGGNGAPEQLVLREDVVPTTEQMSFLLERVQQVDDMKRLHDVAAAWEDVTRRMKRAFEEVATIAEFRIRLERKIGQQLLEVVGHGGDRSRLHNVIAPPEDGLPDSISPRMKSWYRNVAKVPEEVFDTYLARQKERMKLPSSNGVISFGAALVRGAGPRKPKKRDGQKDPVQPGAGTMPMVPDVVVDVVQRLLTVDVLVGGDPKALPNAQAVKVDSLQGRHLRGDVFVAECRDPASWLPRLAGARTKGAVVQVVVVVPAATAADWFKLVADGQWTCWFPTGSSVAVLYAGDKIHGFWLLAHSRGAVLPSGAWSQCHRPE